MCAWVHVMMGCAYVVAMVGHYAVGVWVQFGVGRCVWSGVGVPHARILGRDGSTRDGLMLLGVAWAMGMVCAQCKMKLALKCGALWVGI